jgi:hypothetical protein
MQCRRPTPWPPATERRTFFSRCLRFLTLTDFRIGYKNEISEKIAGLKQFAAFSGVTPMNTKRFSVPGLSVALIALAFTMAPAFAQVDISGDWATRTHEDQPHRGPGAELGDYTGLPINEAVRQRASDWDASILSLPEHQGQPHPGMYFMRGPGPNIRVKMINDPVTQKLIAYTIEGVFGRDDRVIWMDGRPSPSEDAEHTWEGFSTGKAEGNQLTIFTDHLKYGVIQRNGVAASFNTSITEHFIRHGDFLTLVIIVNDPVYLEEPFIRTSQWVRSSNLANGGDIMFRFETVDEIAGHTQGYVPHYPLGTKQDSFAVKHGIPFEATQGGKETIYPEYELKLKKMIADQAQQAPDTKK